MENIFEQFGTLLTQNIWVAILFALIAGILSSFTPCALSSIPLIIGYVGGYSDNDKKKSFIYSLVFSLGLAITFTVLGVLSATIGRMFIGIETWWYIILGVILLAVGLQMFGVIKIGSNACSVPKKSKGVFGAFLLGIMGGIFSSPCSTPVLIAILAFVAEKGNILLGGILLLVYAIGHCILVVIAGTSVGFVQSFVNSNKTSNIANILKYIFATLVILLALYMFYLGF
ncbi:MAG: cytochrome c biogenesis CcdA family protein [Clostridia bacterium]|nr:cytochrome c biogenesis CcdA family protein [Clostridia bacterium]MDD4387062.1 cytochrome c biogenesis CcdA family protein [Clostridia bacterium]